MGCSRLTVIRSSLGAALMVATMVAGAAGLHSEAGPPPGATVLVEAVGTTLRARRPDGSTLEGAALVGAVLVVAFDGQTVRVRIAHVEPDARDPRGEVLLYDFRVIGPNGTEASLCRPDPDGRQLGLPLAGRRDAAGNWRPGAASDFELICTSGAQGKCVRFGYAPWRLALDGRPMTDWYNACVHMVRADYCGDGRPFTRDGTIIDIYDRIGVQKSDDDPSLSFEAAWGPDGAVCVARPRIADLIDLDGLARACPRLAGKLGPGVCSQDAPGGLISNRSR
jgi:hypothetical protein